MGNHRKLRDFVVHSLLNHPETGVPCRQIAHMNADTQTRRDTETQRHQTQTQRYKEAYTETRRHTDTCLKQHFVETTSFGLLLKGPIIEAFAGFFGVASGCNWIWAHWGFFGGELGK